MAGIWCLVALLCSPALALSPATRLWGDADTDALTVPWTLWHAAWQLVEDHSLGGHTTMVAWPDGGTFWPATPLEGAVLAPVTLLAGAVLASNLLQLLHVGLAGGCTYALLRRVSGSWAAAMAVTPLLALSPVLLCSAHNGNPEAAQLYWLPLVGLATWEAMRHRRAWPVLVAGLVLALALVSNTYGGIAAGVVALGMIALAGTRRWWRGIGIFASAGLLAAPVLAWAMKISTGQGSILQRSAELVSRQRMLQGQASLVDLLIPGTHHALGPDLEPTAFLVGVSLGITAGVLVVVALLQPSGRGGLPRARRLVLAGLMIVGTLMALGPRLKVAGVQVEGAGIPLPWLLLDSLPPFCQLIELWRFAMVIHVGAALLLGLWLAGRSRWIALSVGLALLLEGALLNPGPAVWRSTPLAHPELVELFAGVDEGPVLHLPARQGFWPLYFQTLHQRPVGVSTEQPVDEALLGHLARPGWSLASLRFFARGRDMRWLVIHVRDDMEALQDVRTVAADLHEAGLVARSHGELLLVDLEAPGPWPQRDYRSRGLPGGKPGTAPLDPGRAPSLYREAPR